MSHLHEENTTISLFRHDGLKIKLIRTLKVYAAAGVEGGTVAFGLGNILRFGADFDGAGGEGGREKDEEEVEGVHRH